MYASLPPYTLALSLVKHGFCPYLASVISSPLHSSNVFLLEPSLNLCTALCHLTSGSARPNFPLGLVSSVLSVAQRAARDRKVLVTALKCLQALANDNSKREEAGTAGAGQYLLQCLRDNIIDWEV